MNSATAWSAIRAQFPAARSAAYFNTAAEGLWPDGYPGAFDRYRQAKAAGSAGRDELARIETEARQLTAALLGVAPSSIAFLGSASRGLEAVLGAIGPAAGDNIVMPDTEFPAAILIGQRLRERGVEARLVPAANGVVDEAALAARVDERTRAIVVSAVSFITGVRVRLDVLASLIDRGRTKLVVDGTQAAGVVDLQLAHVDAFVASTYKWLLGAHGLGVLYLDPETMAELRPPYSGWRGIDDLFGADRLTSHHLHPDSRRFEEGMPNTLGLAVLVDALRLLDSIGHSENRQRTRELTDLLFEQLTAARIDAGPTDPDRRSSILTIQCPGAEALAQHLVGEGVHVWGRSDVLRLSPYFYNDEDDVARAIRALVVAGPWKDTR